MLSRICLKALSFSASSRHLQTSSAVYKGNSDVKLFQLQAKIAPNDVKYRAKRIVQILAKGRKVTVQLTHSGMLSKDERIEKMKLISDCIKEIADEEALSLDVQLAGNQIRISCSPTT